MVQDEINVDRMLIWTTLFDNEIHNQRLVETGNRKNIILYSDMDFQKGVYNFWFDTGKGQAINGPSGGYNPREILISIPEPALQRSHIGNEDMIKVLNRRSISDQAGFQIIDAVTQRRLHGIKPEIGFLEDRFEVNLSLDRLELIGDRRKTLRFEKMTETSEGLLLPYDTLGKKIWEYDPLTVKEIPEGVKLFEIPPKDTLDPVGFALVENKSPTIYLARAGIIANLKAQEVDWGKHTNVPLYIKRNNETPAQSEDKKQSKNKNKKQGLR